MRVAQVVPFGVHPYSGVLHALVGLTKALARKGITVEVWQLEDWPDAAQDLAETLDGCDIPRVLLPTPRTRWHLGKSARQFIAGRPVDIVHFHGAFSPMNNLLSRALRVPFVLSPHGGYSPAVTQRRPLRKLLFKHLFEQPMITRASALWALTEAEKEDITRFCAHRCIEVGPSGYEPAFQTADPTAFRKELGLESDSLLALFVGRLDIYYKRLDRLIESLSETPNWHLALIGPDWNGSASKLAALIQRRKLEDRVYLLGPRRGQALHEALAAATLFVLMSRSEGLPLALLEAFSHGLPALVSPEVEAAVEVAAASAGWTCRPEDLMPTLNGLARLDARKWRKARTEAARRSKQYQWDETLVPYILTMERLVSSLSVGLCI